MDLADWVLIIIMFLIVVGASWVFYTLGLAMGY